MVENAKGGVVSHGLFREQVTVGRKQRRGEFHDFFQGIYNRTVSYELYHNSQTMGVNEEAGDRQVTDDQRRDGLTKDAGPKEAQRGVEEDKAGDRKAYHQKDLGYFHEESEKVPKNISDQDGVDIDVGSLTGIVG